MNIELAVPACPDHKQTVYELLISAGHDVSDWLTTADNRVVANPNTNTGRNTSWSYVGKENEPVVLCIWYNNVSWGSTPPTYLGNEYKSQNRLKEAAPSKQKHTSHTTLKLRQSSLLHKAIFEAHKNNRPVRVILVDGEQVPIEESAYKASTVTARALDTATWFVHDMDAISGDYKIVRGIQKSPPQISVEDEVVDPIIDPRFQALLNELSDTEREALIKARIGQGIFKDRLLERWRGCSVSGCTLPDMLIASHIRPWSKCDNPNDRLSVSNGLLLTPNLDKLFDSGYISFDDDFRIIISELLPHGFAMMFGVGRSMKLTKTTHQDLRPYLKWHRENIFKEKS